MHTDDIIDTIDTIESLRREFGIPDEDIDTAYDLLAAATAQRSDNIHRYPPHLGAACISLALDDAGRPLPLSILAAETGEWVTSTNIARSRSQLRSDSDLSIPPSTPEDFLQTAADAFDDAIIDRAAELLDSAPATTYSGRKPAGVAAAAVYGAGQSLADEPGTAPTQAAVADVFGVSKGPLGFHTELLAGSPYSVPDDGGPELPDSALAAHDIDPGTDHAEAAIRLLAADAGWKEGEDYRADGDRSRLYVSAWADLCDTEDTYAQIQTLLEDTPVERGDLDLDAAVRPSGLVKLARDQVDDTGTDTSNDASAGTEDRHDGGSPDIWFPENYAQTTPAETAADYDLVAWAERGNDALSQSDLQRLLDTYADVSLNSRANRRVIRVKFRE